MKLSDPPARLLRPHSHSADDTTTATMERISKLSQQLSPQPAAAEAVPPAAAIDLFSVKGKVSCTLTPYTHPPQVGAHLARRQGRNGAHTQAHSLSSYPRSRPCAG